MSSSSESPSPGPLRCWSCGAVWKGPSHRCWLCDAEPPGEEPVAAIVLSPAPHKPFQYGLSSLLLIMTLVCIVGSVTTMAPGLGIALMVLGIPALVHTCITALRSEASGKPMSAGEKTRSFVLALITAFAVAALALVAAVATLFVVCAGALAVDRRSSDWLFVLALIMGSVAGLGVLVAFLVVYVRRQRRKRRP